MLTNLKEVYEASDERLVHLFSDYNKILDLNEEELVVQCQLLTEFIIHFYKFCSDLNLPLYSILDSLKDKLYIYEVQELYVTFLTFENFYSHSSPNIEIKWNNPFIYINKYEQDLNNTFSVLLLEKLCLNGFQDLLLAYNRSTYLKPAYLHKIYHSLLESYFTSDAIVLLDILRRDFNSEEDATIHHWITLCLTKFESELSSFKTIIQ